MKRIFKPGAKVKASSGYAGVNLDAAQIDVDQNDQQKALRRGLGHLFS